MNAVKCGGVVSSKLVPILCKLYINSHVLLFKIDTRKEIEKYTHKNILPPSAAYFT